MDAIARIELYNNLFYVFAGISAVSFLLAVFFFFRFNIPEVYSMISGKGRRKGIQEMEIRNAQTGRLRSGSTASKPGSSRKSGQKRKPAPTSPPPAVNPPRQAQPQPERREAPPQEVRQEPLETAVLSQQPAETMVLQETAAQTTMLTEQKQTGQTEELTRTEHLIPQKSDFFFQLTENTISINTDEII